MEFGKEILGTFQLDNITFEGGYRYDGNRNHQGGYEKCLRIYNGKDGDNNNIWGHNYFGDDKFEVINAVIYPNQVTLTLRYPLCKKSSHFTLVGDNRTIILIK
jgi:hypothetical protein